MKIKTFYTAFLLLLALNLTSCGSSKDSGMMSNEQVQEQLAKENKNKAKAGKKLQKEAYKNYWRSQSKQARKSIKENARRQKRIARHRKKNGR